MAHFRGTIRAEIKSRMQDLPGQTLAPLDARDQVIPQEHLPVPFVLLGDEELTDPILSESGATSHRRTLTVTVGVAAQTVTALDSLSEEIERRMQPSLGVGVHHELASVSIDGPSRGERDFHSIGYRYAVHYRIDPLNSSEAI